MAADNSPKWQEGPIHDVRWAASGEFFAVAAGFMPARTTVFSARCQTIADLGSGPHNLVRWSPQVLGLLLKDLVWVSVFRQLFSQAFDLQTLNAICMLLHSALLAHLHNTGPLGHS